MIVKSFVLKQRSIAQIAALCDSSTIAVVRPGKKIEALFRDAVRKTVVEKKQAFDEIVAIREHFCAMATGDEYIKTVDETVDTVATYLHEAMYVQTSAYALEDYVLAKCSRLCAEAVYQQVGGTLLDGSRAISTSTGRLPRSRSPAAARACPAPSLSQEDTECWIPAMWCAWERTAPT